jgi:hypothetical protein
MKRVLKLIYSSNEWYDDLPDGKRELFFVFVILGTLAITQTLVFCYDIWYALPIWYVTFFLWRLPYMFRPKKTYTFDIETGGHFDNMFLVDFEERGKKQEFYDTKAMQEFIGRKMDENKTKDEQ